jgi:hypothetical protein
MNTHRGHLESTRDFVKENLTAIVKEAYERDRTGKLIDNGKFREAAQKLNYVSSMGHHANGSYIAGRFNIVEAMMNELLIHDHLIRAGHLGENI